MAICNFHFTDIQNPESLLKKAKDAIKEAGGKVTGDATSGSFYIPIPIVQDIIGKYAFNNSDLLIEITSKPVIISCERIKEEIKKYLESDYIS